MTTSGPTQPEQRLR